jgi:hypothetical protein
MLQRLWHMLPRLRKLGCSFAAKKCVIKRYSRVQLFLAPSSAWSELNCSIESSDV